MKLNLLQLINFLSLLTLLFSSCKTQNNNQPKPFGASVICSSFTDINYGTQGTNPSQTLDLYVPHISKPGRSLNPIVIFIHGGGFINGDKQQTKNPLLQNPDVASLLNDGIAFVSINYPLISLDPADNIGIIKCLNNCKAAIQFLRSHAASYNIDPDNIALWGDSAGAGLAMFIGFNTSVVPNPIKAIFVDKPQATYDLEKWSTEIFSTICSSTEICDILTFDPDPGNPPDLEFYMQSVYGMGPGTFNCSDVINFNNSNYPVKVDILHYIDNGDPPIWIQNKKPQNNVALSQCTDNNNQNGLIDRNMLNHHINHAIRLKNQCINAGLEWYYRNSTNLESSIPSPPPNINSGLEFIKSKL